MSVPKWQLGSFVTDNEVQIVTGDVRLVGHARGDNYSEAVDRGLLMSAAPELLEVAELVGEYAEANNSFQAIPPWEEGSPRWHELRTRVLTLENQIASKRKAAVAKARGRA